MGMSRPRRISQGSFGGGEAEIVPGGARPGGDGERPGKRVASDLSAAPRSGAQGGVRGWVVTSDRRAVPDATVAVSGGPPHPDIAAMTGDDGTFSLGDLSPGRYELTVHKHGYDSASAQF